MSLKMDEVLGHLQGSGYTFNTTLLSNKSIQVSLKPMTVKDQKSLIVNTENESYSNQIKAMTTLLKSCVKSCPCQIEDLSIQDFIWLILKLRIYSQGSTLKLNVNCEKCGEKTSNVEIDLEKHLITNYLDGIKDNLIKIDDDLTIVLCLPKIKSLFNFDKTNTVLDLLVSEIDYIEYKGEIIELTEQDKIKLLESLDTKFIKNFETFDASNKYGVKLKFPFKCKCGHEKEVEVEDNILSFF